MKNIFCKEPSGSGEAKAILNMLLEKKGGKVKDIGYEWVAMEEVNGEEIPLIVRTIQSKVRAACSHCGWSLTSPVSGLELAHKHALENRHYVKVFFESFVQYDASEEGRKSRLRAGWERIKEKRDKAKKREAESGSGLLEI